MFNNALDVESNLMASGNMKQRVEVNRRKNREESQTSTSVASSSSDANFEMIMKNMESVRLDTQMDLESK